jgi:hypothetical protein
VALEAGRLELKGLELKGLELESRLELAALLVVSQPSVGPLVKRVALEQEKAELKVVEQSV